MHFPLIVFFYLYVYIFVEICLKLFYLLTFSNSYYIYFDLEDIENDLNRIGNFLINLWNYFQISFLNFINLLAMFFDNLPWRQLIQFMI